MSDLTGALGGHGAANSSKQDDLAEEAKIPPKGGGDPKIPRTPDMVNRESLVLSVWGQSSGELMKSQ